MSFEAQLDTVFGDHIYMEGFNDKLKSLLDRIQQNGANGVSGLNRLVNGQNSIQTGNQVPVQSAPQNNNIVNIINQAVNDMTALLQLAPPDDQLMPQHKQLLDRVRGSLSTLQKAVPQTSRNLPPPLPAQSRAQTASPLPAPQPVAQKPPQNAQSPAPAAQSPAQPGISPSTTAPQPRISPTVKPEDRWQDENVLESIAIDTRIIF